MFILQFQIRLKMIFQYFKLKMLPDNCNSLIHQQLLTLHAQMFFHISCDSAFTHKYHLPLCYHAVHMIYVWNFMKFHKFLVMHTQPIICCMIQKQVLSHFHMKMKFVFVHLPAHSNVHWWLPKSISRDFSHL